jgi:sucrose-phosphate synthase
VTLSLHLVSDLDGTWLPAADGSPELRELEAFLSSQPGIVLTFATGRGLESALSALHGLASLMPRHFVTDVGTTIHDRDGSGKWVEDMDYALWVGARWDEEAAERVVQRVLPAGVRPQPWVNVRRRLALEVEEGIDALEAAEQLAAKLEGEGFLADVLASNARCLDVLPKGVHKGSAVEHLRSRDGLPSPLVVCGDSENDLAMLRVADVPVLMPGSLRADCVRTAAGRVLRAPSPGPGGILEVLLELTSPTGREGL